MQNQTEQALREQKFFSDKVKAITHIYSHKPLAFVKTYGCQQNFSDSEKLRGMLSEMGYDITNKAENADVIFFNTCAIRENAESKVFGNVGALKHLKEKKPDLVIGLCGCMVQQEHAALEFKNKFPFIDIIFGTHVNHTLPELLFNKLFDNKKQFSIPAFDGGITEGLPVVRDSGFKASVSIMYGCNNFCTYCIVPYVRGRERSREANDILNEVRTLINDGYKEITLLGQNVNSYGKNTETDFPKLLSLLDNLEGEFKIEYMTSHPKDLNRDVINVISQSKNISRHLHLPVQSGSNRVLGLMNRGYTREDYIEKVEYAREKIPDISITTDIIVGFPGETYENFTETLELMREVVFDSAFTFVYSKRTGTKAAEMVDVVSGEVKSEWFKELLKVQSEIGDISYNRFVGKTLRVLCEGKGRTNKNFFTGRSNQGIIVDFPANEEFVGKFVDVNITEALSWALLGLIK